MTEHEYLNTTDLAKVRMALYMLSCIIPIDEENAELLHQSIKELRKLEENLNKIVVIEFTAY